MELTPEERQRIFEEEEIRAEARTQIEKAQKEQSREARRVSRGKAKKIIVFSCVAIALLTVVVWKVRLKFANDELIAMVHQAKAYVGTSPSYDDWILISGRAMTCDRNGDRRGAAALYIRSLEYADTHERVASTYQSLGWQFDHLDIIDEAEYCYRLAVGLTEGTTHDFRRQCLADVLVKQKKYGEAESIYRDLLPRASKALDRAILNGDLEALAAIAGRKQEADNYEKVSQKAWKDSSHETY